MTALRNVQKSRPQLVSRVGFRLLDVNQNAVFLALLIPSRAVNRSLRALLPVFHHLLEGLSWLLLHVQLVPLHRRLPLLLLL